MHQYFGNQLNSSAFPIIFAQITRKMKIKFLGHSSFHIDFGGTNLIIDPFITGGPYSKQIDISKLKADYILISHGHADHNADAEAIAKNTGAKIISNYEIVSWFEKKGLKGHGMNHGGKHEFDFGTVKYVVATHSSNMPDGSYGGNPGGFVVWNENNCFYFAGDTGLTMDMKLIPLMCPKLDYAILPIGDNYTMGYEEAVVAAQFVETKNVIPCHYDTMPLIKVDHKMVSQAFKKSGLNLRFLKVNETLETSKWVK